MQTIGSFDSYNAVSYSPHLVDKAETFSTINPLSKTPVKKNENKSEEKSLIDVSKNLSNCKYLPSHTKEFSE